MSRVSSQALFEMRLLHEGMMHGRVTCSCLWLENLPLLVPTNIVDGRTPRSFYESPHPDRWKRRSRTFQGIADAMAEQWGGLGA